MTQLQILDGLPLQVLDGNDTSEERIKRHYTKGMDAETARDIQLVREGADLEGFAGDNSVEDSEKMRNFLLRTRRIVRRAPSTIEGYQSAGQFLGMIDYVLQGWDTGEREERIENAANEEARLISSGAINPQIAGDPEFEEIDPNDYDPDDYTEIRSVDERLVGRRKRELSGFFSKLKKATNNIKLSKSAQSIAAANPLTKNAKTRVRGLFRKARKKKALRDKTGKKFTQNVAKITVKKAATLSGFGNDDDTEIRNVVYGDSLCGFGIQDTAEKDVQILKDYLSDVRNAVCAHPDWYCTADKKDNIIKALDILILNIGTEDATNDTAITKAASAAPALDGFFKKIGKKLKKAVKKVAKVTKKVVKATVVAPTKLAVKATKKVVKATVVAPTKFAVKATKKVVKAVAKVVKKVVKFIIKFNPLSIMIRAGILLALQMNLFKLAQKAYPALMSDAERAEYGISEDDYDKAKRAYSKLKSVFVKTLGGRESKLKAKIEKGARRKFTGPEDYDPKVFTDEYNNQAADVQEYYDAEYAELKNKGAIENNDENNLYSEGNEEVEVVEDAPAANKAAVSGLMGMGYYSGLGEPATIASAGAAAGFIAKIVSFFKNIGVKALSLVKKAKAAINATKAGKAISKASKVINTINSMKKGSNAGGGNGQQADNADDYYPDNAGYEENGNDSTKRATATQAFSPQANALQPTQTGNKKWWIIGGIAGVVSLATIFLLTRKTQQQ